MLSSSLPLHYQVALGNTLVDKGNAAVEKLLKSHDSLKSCGTDEPDPAQDLLLPSGKILTIRINLNMFIYVTGYKTLHFSVKINIYIFNPLERLSFDALFLKKIILGKDMVVLLTKVMYIQVQGFYLVTCV